MAEVEIHQGCEESHRRIQKIYCSFSRPQALEGLNQVDLPQIDQKNGGYFHETCLQKTMCCPMTSFDDEKIEAWLEFPDLTLHSSLPASQQRISLEGCNYIPHTGRFFDLIAESSATRCQYH